MVKKVDTLANRLMSAMKMQNIGVCHTYSDGVYRISINDYRTSNLELLEMGAHEAAAFLEKELGQRFYVITRLD